jgi:membrane protein DedA with SNARE-associated domain
MDMASGSGIFFLIALAAALFVGGTPALVSAIYFAVAGEIHIGLLLFLSVVTTLVWDTIWYVVGHRVVSIDRVRSWDIYRRNSVLYEHVFALYGRFQYLLLFLSRFMYGTNSVCSIASGLHRMPFGYFLGVGAASIVVQFGILYALSLGLHRQLASLGAPYSFIVAIVVLIALVFAVRYGIRKFFDSYTP